MLLLSLEQGLEEMKKMLLLLLGCAVQVRVRLSPGINLSHTCIQNTVSSTLSWFHFLYGQEDKRHLSDADNKYLCDPGFNFWVTAKYHP